MIDFKQKRSMGRYGCEGLEEWNALNGYAAKIREDLEASKTNFFWLGVHLIDLYSSNLYRLTFDREKLGVSGLVDNCSAECFFAYCFDGFYFDGMSECVHGNAGLDSASGVFVTAFVIFDFRVRFQPGPERKGREPERVFVHIDEYRMGTDITDSIAGGNEGERLDQDLVLLTGINEEKGKMQGIGSVYTDYGLAGLGVFGDSFLEQVYKRSHTGNESGIDAFFQIFFFIPAKYGYAQRNKILCSV